LYIIPAIGPSENIRVKKGLDGASGFYLENV